MLVLAVTAAQCLDITELWVAFGAGKSFRYLAAHEMAKALGSDRCTALPMLHAFTGCHRFWSGQEECMEYFDGLLRLSCHTRCNAIEDWMEVLERFVVLLYDRTSSQ